MNNEGAYQDTCQVCAKNVPSTEMGARARQGHDKTAEVRRWSVTMRPPTRPKTASPTNFGSQSGRKGGVLAVHSSPSEHHPSLNRHLFTDNYKEPRILCDRCYRRLTASMRGAYPPYGPRQLRVFRQCPDPKAIARVELGKLGKLENENLSTVAACASCDTNSAR